MTDTVDNSANTNATDAKPTDSAIEATDLGSASNSEAGMTDDQIQSRNAGVRKIRERTKRDRSDVK